MDILRMSEYFHRFRATADWKEFETAMENLLKSPACAEFEAAIAPATRKLEFADLFDLLAGFVREDEPLPSGTVRVSVPLVYKEFHEYNDRPAMMLSEVPTDVTILIGDKSFPQTIPLFEFERGTIRMRYGRAILDGISRLDELDGSAASKPCRMLINGSNVEIPIQFFNVVTETDKYTGEQTTFSDFCVLWQGDL